MRITPAWVTITASGTASPATKSSARRCSISGDSPQAERAKQNGILFAAGLITGEALMGIFIAIPIVLTGRADVLALPETMQFGGWLGLLLLSVIAWLLYRYATKPEEKAL